MQNYFFGLTYDSCCVAVRGIVGRTFDALSPTNQPQFNNAFFLQILFKGLGTVANNEASTLLNTHIPGYRDLFA